MSNEQLTLDAILARQALDASCRTVLAYMREHGSITSREGVMELDMTRVLARVWELQQAGYPITDRWETAANGSRYKRFFLEKGR